MDSRPPGYSLKMQFQFFVKIAENVGFQNNSLFPIIMDFTEYLTIIENYGFGVCSNVLLKKLKI
ncbi:unnamed protein product [Arctogadus glacialis]